MDFTLRCNALKCRKVLNECAIVTTCSHIFCTECSNGFRFSRQGQPNGQQAICPACDVLLPNPDDVVMTNLNPAEDYKTSVLSGLSPSIIMECAGRALSFWTYQTTQEIVYQDYLAKNLKERCTSLLADETKIRHAAKSDIEKLSNQLEAVAVERDNLKTRHQELSQAFREKNRKYLQSQEQYDKLKRSTMLGQVQNAAFDAVEQAVQASARANRFENDPEGHSNEPSMYRQNFAGTHNPPNANGGSTMGPPPRRRSEESWAGFAGPAMAHQNQIIQTPSNHRQRLTVNMPNSIAGLTHGQAASAARMTTPATQHIVTGAGSGATPPGFAGYGMSAGLRVSNPSSMDFQGFARPNNRSRVAQRSSSGGALNRNLSAGPGTIGGIMPNGGAYF